MIKIVFVCHGNICRSPMAEFVMKDLVKKAGLQEQFHITSAATSREEIGNPVHKGTKAILQKYNINAGAKTAIQLRKEDYEKYDYIIGMDAMNIRNILRIVKEDNLHKVSLLLNYANEHRDIADPWYSGDFESTYRDVKQGCIALLEVIQKKYNL